jgi:uracil-DNA glycosylase family 4
VIDDPAEALDILLEELRRQKATGVRHVSVSDGAMAALKALAIGAAPSPLPASSLRPPVAAGPKPVAGAEAPAQLVIPPPPIFTIPAGSKAERMQALTALIHACVETRRHLSANQHPVVGTGSLSAKVLFVGDAPTVEEVEAGKPFVGPSGDLLQRILTATAIPAEDIFLVNVMVWRPEPPTVFGKRPPTVKELAFNHPYLKAQIEIVRPQVIVALGAVSYTHLRAHET